MCIFYVKKKKVLCFLKIFIIILAKAACRVYSTSNGYAWILYVTETEKRHQTDVTGYNCLIYIIEWQSWYTKPSLDIEMSILSFSLR